MSPDSSVVSVIYFTTTIAKLKRQSKASKVNLRLYLKHYMVFLVRRIVYKYLETTSSTKVGNIQIILLKTFKIIKQNADLEQGRAKLLRKEQCFGSYFHEQ